MKAIKVTYRAEFQQPLGGLNPLGVTLKAPIAVEVFETSNSVWRLRRPDTTTVFEPITGYESAQSACEDLVPAWFQKRLTGWVMCWQGKPLLKGEYIEKQGRFYLLEAEDFTHIQKPGPGPDTKHKLALALCGNEFKFSAFASTLENAPPPTCKTCAAMYQGGKA